MHSPWESTQLAALAARAGLTGRDVADRYGVPLGALEDLVADPGAMTVRELLALAEAVGAGAAEVAEALGAGGGAR